ncbi:hypothetical protein Taro_038555 [Colocasia esculenta]|uniref:Uncharacterized protein n=1 Tax=Colocasia esculenta TaxID=4460 RepID=A0A843WT16_COLES|nr:hypothetical protein [Colocasia esculenta]
MERQLDLSSVAARLRVVLRSRLAFPTEPVTSKAHPYSPQARARRRFLYRRPVRSRDVAAVVMADRRDWGGGGDDPE